MIDNKKWCYSFYCFILLIIAGLLLSPETHAITESFPTPLPGSSKQGNAYFTNTEWEYSLEYLASWEAQVPFSNTHSTPAYVIRERTQFVNTDGAFIIAIDVWERANGISPEAWFEVVEEITQTVQSNAIISGQRAFVFVWPGSCGVHASISTYVFSKSHVFKIHTLGKIEEDGLSGYETILKSFTLLNIPLPLRSQHIITEFGPMAPTTCGTNICPSTCSGGCTFAATTEGCCGYHAISRWQCSKACNGSQIGEFKGNCVWWAAYTRRDVGALASGDAGNWAVSIRTGNQLPVDSTPKLGDIVVHPSSYYTHVAYVVWVSPDASSYKVSDMGWCIDCGPMPEEETQYDVDADNEFIHCAGNPPIPSSDWSFTNCPFGWTPSKGFSDSNLNGATWAFNPGTDPYLLSPIISVGTSQYNAIEVEMKSSAQNTTGKLYFTTSSSTDFDETKSIAFTINNDGQWHSYILNTSANSYWSDTITRIRIDPVENGNGDNSYDNLEIRRVRFTNTQTPPTISLYTPAENRWYNTDQKFSWTISDQDFGVRGYKVAWNTNPPGGDEIAATSGITNLSAAGQGWHTLYVQAWDNLTNTATASAGWFGYDTTVPTVTLLLNHGAITTEQTTVALDLTYGDTGSGVREARASNNGLAWSDWTPIAAALPWAIPALDLTTLPVYVQVRDGAGNLSAVVSDTIALDLYPPAPHSANYRMCSTVVNTGGTAGITSTGYSLVSSIGQAWNSGADGYTSTAFTTGAGFLADVDGCRAITRPAPRGFDIPQWVVASGGNTRSSAGYRLGDTTGEASVSGATPMQSPGYQLSGGFWGKIIPPPCPSPLTGARLTGPLTGTVGSSLTFTAILTPANATAPLTLTWTPAPLSGQGTLTATYQWATAGSKTIRLSAQNCGGTRTAQHTLTVLVPAPDHTIYLPLVLRSRP